MSLWAVRAAGIAALALGYQAWRWLQARAERARRAAEVMIAVIRWFCHDPPAKLERLRSSLYARLKVLLASHMREATARVVFHDGSLLYSVLAVARALAAVPAYCILPA